MAVCISLCYSSHHSIWSWKGLFLFTFPFSPLLCRRSKFPTVIVPRVLYVNELELSILDCVPLSADSCLLPYAESFIMQKLSLKWCFVGSNLCILYVFKIIKCTCINMLLYDFGVASNDLENAQKLLERGEFPFQCTFLLSKCLVCISHRLQPDC